MKKEMKWIVGALVILTVSILACDSKEEAPEVWSVDRSAAPSSSSGEPKKGDAPVATSEVVKGSALNGVFLADDYSGFKRVFVTEKEGFSQADYKKGDEVAFTLSVTDLKDEADLRTRYDDVAEKVGDHPYMARGKGSMVLVDGRFQVKLTSDTMDETTRKEHLSKLNFSQMPR